MRSILEEFDFELIHLSGFNSQYGIQEILGKSKSIGEITKGKELKTVPKITKSRRKISKNLVNNVKFVGRVALQFPIVDNLSGHLLLAVCRNRKP